MLTPKKQLFVNFYHAKGETYLNAKKSAIAAGFSAKTAKQAGSRLLSDADVKAAIEKLKAKLCDKLEISAERVLGELAKLAFANPQDYVDENGKPRAIHELTRDQAAAISSFKVVLIDDSSKVAETKLHDKKASLELLGRNLKLFTDKIEVETGPGLAEALQAARKRVGKR